MTDSRDIDKFVFALDTIFKAAITARPIVVMGINAEWTQERILMEYTLAKNAALSAVGLPSREYELLRNSR